MFPEVLRLPQTWGIPLGGRCGGGQKALARASQRAQADHESSANAQRDWSMQENDRVGGMSGGGFGTHPTLLVEQVMHHQLHRESSSARDQTNRPNLLARSISARAGAPLPTNPALHHLEGTPLLPAWRSCSKYKV